MHSPFKFLDSFTKEDKDIYFGRERETEELYQRIFESKILLVYGVSGTGKSSLIHCGLANKFNDSDWLPINIRRGANINESLYRELEKFAITALPLRKGEQEGVKPKTNVKKALHSLYLDHFKPIYLVFDQFEELFIFGSKAEREEFIKTVKEVAESELNVRFIFVIREEYLASITEFEKEVRGILNNRIRIEKMTRVNATHCIEGPCRVAGIEMDKDFTEELLDKLSPNSADVELTYLQVFLDKIYRTSASNAAISLEKGEQEGIIPDLQAGNGIRFTLPTLQKLGNVSDLLGSFLEEQIEQFPDPGTGLTILKSFVSTRGTKRQITEEEVGEYSRTLGKNISEEQIREYIQRFVALRILRDKDDNGRYELRHDALAAKIYEKITLVEKDLLEIRQFIENAYSNYEKRDVLLSENDLKYLAPYEDKLFLNEKLEEFVKKSKEVIASGRRLKKQVTFFSVLGIVLLLAAITYYNYRKTKETKASELAAISLIELEKDPTLAYRLAEEAYKLNPEATLAQKAFFNAYNTGPFYNELEGTGFAVSPDGNLIITTGKDSTLHLYKGDGTKIKTLKENAYHLINTNAFSPDGKYFLTTTNVNDAAAVLWSSSGERIKAFPRQTKPMLDAWFSPKGNYIITSSFEDRTNIYNLKGELILKLGDGQGIYDIIDISADEKTIAYAVKDSTYKKFEVKVLSLPGGKLIKTISDNIRPVRRIRFNKSAQYFYVSSFDETVRVYDKSGKFIFKPEGIAPAFSPDATLLVTQSTNGIIYTYTLNGKKINQSKVAAHDLGVVNLSPDNKYMFVSTDKEETLMWDIQTNSLAHVARGNLAALSPDEKIILTVDDNDRSIRGYGKSGELFRLKGHQKAVADHKVRMTSQGYIISAGTADEPVKIWKPDLNKSMPLNIDLKNYAISPDDKNMVFTEWNGSSIYFADVKTLELDSLKAFSHPNNVYSDFSKTGKYFYTVSWDTLRIWRTKDKTHVTDLSVDKSKTEVWQQKKVVSYSPDDKYFVATSKESGAKIYAEDGTVMTALNGHRGPVLYCDYSSAGNYIVTASADSTAILWKFEPEKKKAKQLQVWSTEHKGKVMSANFSPDGKYIITASADSTVVVEDFERRTQFVFNSDPEGHWNLQQLKENRAPFQEAVFLNGGYILTEAARIDTVFWFDPRALAIIKATNNQKRFTLWSDQPYDDISPLIDETDVKAIDVHSSEFLIAMEKEGIVSVIKDESKTPLGNFDLEEMYTIKGRKPKYSFNGKSLYVVDENALKIYPATVKEILHKVNKEQVYGSFRQLTDFEKRKYGVK